MSPKPAGPPQPAVTPRQAGAAFASGVLVVLAFPLFGSEIGLDWLVWIALVPFLLGTTGVGLRRGALLGACMGVTIEAAGFLWILMAMRRFTELPSAVTTLGFLLWVLYSSTPWTLLGAAVGRARPSNLLWVLPFWVGVEHLFPRLFPWHLGGAVNERVWLLQTVDLWGASGLTGLVLLVSVTAAHLVRAATGRGRFPRWHVGATVLFCGGALTYGALRLESVRAIEKESPSVVVALIQGALHPFDRSRTALDVYFRSTRRALVAASAADEVELVLWPEGAAEKDGYYPFDLAPDQNPRRDLWEGKDLLPLLQAFASEHDVPMVVGGSGYLAGRDPPFSNVAAYIRPGKPLTFYEKNVRLPFGEVIPFLSAIPRSLRERFGIRVGTIAAGVERPIFPLRDLSFRSLVCYEATLPGFVSRAARGVDFLVNITEDMWYGRTAHIPQHVSVLRLRTVENRTTLLRCTNVGPSGAFLPSGEFLRGTEVFRPEEVVLRAPIVGLSTVYQTVGRHLPWALLVLWGAVVALRRRR